MHCLWWKWQVLLGLMAPWRLATGDNKGNDGRRKCSREGMDDMEAIWSGRRLSSWTRKESKKRRNSNFPCTMTPTLILYNLKPLDKLLFLAFSFFFFFLTFSLLLLPLVVGVCVSRCIKILWFFILFWEIKRYCGVEDCASAYLLT